MSCAGLLKRFEGKELLAYRKGEARFCKLEGIEPESAMTTCYKR